MSTYPGRPETGGQYSDVGPWINSSPNVAGMFPPFQKLCVENKKYLPFFLLKDELTVIATRIWDPDPNKKYEDQFETYTQTKILKKYVQKRYQNVKSGDDLTLLTNLMDSMLENIDDVTSKDDWLCYVKAFRSIDQRDWDAYNHLIEYEHKIPENYMKDEAVSSVDAQSGAANMSVEGAQAEASGEGAQAGGGSVSGGNVQDAVQGFPNQSTLDSSDDESEGDAEERERLNGVGQKDGTKGSGGTSRKDPRMQANLNILHTDAGLDYDVDYIAKRLERLRDW